MPWARASALDRHLACPAASHLPRLDRGVWSPAYLAKPDTPFVAPVVEVEERSTTAADWGTAMHAAKAMAPDASEPFLSWIEPHRERLWPAHLGQHEVAVSYDVRTRKVLTFFSAVRSEREDWKAAQGPDCVVGECDWWASLPTGEPWTDDLKTGWQTPTVVTPQTMFYTMTRSAVVNQALLEAGRDIWTTARISITHMPRARKGEDPEPRRDGLWYQVTDTALLAFEGEIKQAWVRATGLNPEPRPGDHCLYCPSASVCDRANS